MKIHTIFYIVDLDIAKQRMIENIEYNAATQEIIKNIKSIEIQDINSRQDPEFEKLHITTSRKEIYKFLEGLRSLSTTKQMIKNAYEKEEPYKAHEIWQKLLNKNEFIQIKALNTRSLEDKRNNVLENSFRITIHGKLALQIKKEVLKLI